MRLRLSLRMSLAASLVYLFCILAQWIAVALGHVPAREAWLVTAFSAVGALGFFMVLRLGWTRQLRDPAVVKAQMLYGLAALALAYVVNWPVRGGVLMIVALVLAFGAFTMTPTGCRKMGAVSVGLFGIAMAVSHWRRPGQIPFSVEVIHFGLAALVLPVAALLAGQLSQLRIDQRRQRVELRDALTQVRLLATHDELTGLPNRRHMQEWVAQEIARARRTGGATCLALIDLDHFKRVNDQFGHAVGDMALRIFAREARAALREIDLLARWGGEEFLLLLPDTTTANACRVLERLRTRLAQASVWNECPQAQVGFSAGLAALDTGESLDATVQRADAALYEAKRAGRSRTCLAAEPPKPAAESAARSTRWHADSVPH